MPTDHLGMLLPVLITGLHKSEVFMDKILTLE
jgi:hypothetical protein